MCVVPCRPKHWHFVLQAKILAFQISADNGAVVDNKSMNRWLATSFWALPSFRHRHMFLDAATVLQGEPLLDARCVWISIVQNDDGPDGPGGAAASSVDTCLAELITSSLVSVDSVHQEEGSNVLRCGVSIKHARLMHCPQAPKPRHCYSSCPDSACIDACAAKPMVYRLDSA